jgi:hypothetical protein
MTVTSADIQRLQDTIYDASRELSDVRIRDGSLASQLQAELDDARDEAIYLKVKLRKHEPIARGELNDVRDRVENIRSRARGDSGGRYTPPAGSGIEPDRRPAPTSTSGRPIANEIPVGTEFDVRLQNSLSSKTAEVEDRFEATTLVDLRDDRNRVLVPAGSVMRGIVSSVKRAGRLERTGTMTVAFDRVTINGRSYPLRATVTQALESEGIRERLRGSASARAPALSLARFSAAPRARWPASSSAAAARLPRPKGRTSSCRRGRCCGYEWTRRSLWLAEPGE